MKPSTLAACLALVALAACDLLTGLDVVSSHGDRVATDTPFEATVLQPCGGLIDPPCPPEDAPMRLTAVVSSAPDVVRIESIAGLTVALHAAAEGEATVTFRLDTGTELKELTRTYVVEQPSYLLAHVCTAAPLAAYAVGEAPAIGGGAVGVRSGLPVGGAFDPAPVTIAPAGGLVARGPTNPDGTGIAFAPVTEPGEFVVTSSLGGGALTLQFVEAASVTSLRLFTEPHALTAGGLASSERLDLLPFVGDVPMCGTTPPLDVTALTPAVCSADGSVVRGLAAGECRLVYAAPWASHGAGAKLDVSVEVIAAPPETHHEHHFHHHDWDD